MEDFIKLHLKNRFQDFYKKKAETLASFANRVNTVQENRKNMRSDVVFGRRNIPENLSPCVSPMPKIAKTVQNQEKEVSHRLEMLAKWKADKEKRILEAKKHSKPVFKVAHIPIEVGLPNLENVNKQIKGKRFKSKFAPENHKFKPPANIKPINFTNQPRIMTRSQTQKLKSETDTKPQGKAKSKNEVSETKKPLPTPTEANKPNRKTSAKTASEDTKANKSAPSKTKGKVKTTDKNSKTNKLLTPSETSTNEETTPKKQSPPVYVSPFITLSRGKENARKEYHERKSGKTIDCTSPKAGAAHFTWRLDNEITRLRKFCENWNSYKTQDNPPEEAVSMIDVAIGQTNLLITKKFEQFRGLIDRCQNGDSETPVTTEDLHGFWDMIFIQVTNLDKRFENLDKLRKNKWEEVLPEVQKGKTKTRNNALKTGKASEGLKAAIQAARRKKQAQNTPSKRKSLMGNVTSSQTKGSPGLTMMKVAQYAKGVETPSKSILKNKTDKSNKSLTKTVLFQDTENDLNKANLETKAKTPTRKSQRLSRSKLF